MKHVGLTILSLLAVIGALAIGAFLLNQWESTSSRFETYQDLLSSETAVRGWAPEGLPRSARGIDETHHVSSNTGNATFLYDPKDVETTRATCRLLVENETGTAFLCPPFDGYPFLVVLRVNGRGSWSLVNAV